MRNEARLTIRDVIAKKEQCFLPCACLRIHHNGSCADLADTILEALHDLETAPKRINS